MSFIPLRCKNKFEVTSRLPSFDGLLFEIYPRNVSEESGVIRWKNVEKSSRAKNVSLSTSTRQLPHAVYCNKNLSPTSDLTSQFRMAYFQHSVHKKNIQKLKRRGRTSPRCHEKRKRKNKIIKEKKTRA